MSELIRKSASELAELLASREASSVEIVQAHLDRIADVDAFPGHIPCDSASRSELVVPLYRGDELIGVFDLDSPELDRFDEDDQKGLEKIAALFLESLP